MSSLVQDNGLIIRAIRHGETSLIVTAFTPKTGKIGLIAKGARAKTRAGSSGGLELFNELQLVYYHKAGRDLQLLKEWSVIEPHVGLRTNFECMTIASAIIELLNRCLHDDDPHEDLFGAARDTLSALDMNPNAPLPILWSFEMRLFRELGFGLRLRECAFSNRPLTPPYRGNIRYRLSDGGFYHPDVPAAQSRDGELSGEAFALLSNLASASYEFAGRIRISPATQTELLQFFARYLETHLPVRGNLRSLEALRWGKQT